MKKIIPLLLLFIIIVSSAVLFTDIEEKITPLLFKPRNVPVETPGVAQPNNKTNTPATQDIEIVAKDLEIPWEIAFLPNGDMLVTQRGGKVLKIGSETRVIKEVEGVSHIGEGGLLGMALHPDFSKNNFVYLYSTTKAASGITNRVERYKLVDNTLTDKVLILDSIKGSLNHDGGRIAFGPDKLLYTTTGDAENQDLPQDKNSLNGKVLRIKDDGSIPENNPFGNAVYSFGHRNPQGITWDNKGILWITEHGPSGPQTGNDEINIISKGSNYGWPDVRGMETKEGFTLPIIESGKTDTWAPSGAVYWDGSIFFAGLRGEALYEVKIKDGNKLVTHFKKEYGRLRTVVLGPDGLMYVATNNTDGRGIKKPEDDKIIKVNPKIFR